MTRTEESRSWPTLVALSVLLALPCLVFRDVPLLDLPVHIARQHILYDPSLAAMPQHYVVAWRVLPNLALDLFVCVFRFVMPIDAAVRLFLAVTVVQLFLGAVVLNRALFGPGARFGWVAALLAYNGLFMLGLVNLCFGIGMALWVLALWLRSRDRLWAAVPQGLLATLVLLAHLYAFGLYGLLVGCYALGEAVRSRGRSVSARLRALAGDLAHLLVPVAFYLAFVPRGFNDFGGLGWLPLEKLWALATVLGVYDLNFDLGCLALLCTLVAALALVFRALVLAPGMRWPLAALALSFVVLPFHVGQASWVDARVPASFALVLVASLDWRPGDALRRATEWMLGGLFLLRLGVMVVQWASWQPVYAAYHEALGLVAPGARLLPVNTHPGDIVTAEHPPLTHMDAFAVAERGAFIPTMLADRPYELLRYAPADAALRAAFAAAPRSEDYDDALVVHPDAASLPADAAVLYRGPDFVLLRLSRTTPSER